MKRRIKDVNFPVFVRVLLPALALTLGLFSPAGAIEGDLTGDGHVDFNDFARMANNWLQSDPEPPTELPVYTVIQHGITQADANALADELNLSEGAVYEANGVGTYMDPCNFQAVPMVEITDPAL